MSNINMSLGHDFLKALGRTRLRPGGGVMTDYLLESVNINKDTRILEVACNQGDNLIRIYTKYKCNVCGIDLDENVIEQAKENLSLLELSDEISIKHMNALDLQFEDNSFDIIINEAMLTMLRDSDKDKALKEYYRVLKTGGYLLTHDVAINVEDISSRKDLSKMVNMSVFPLTVENWKKKFEQFGFKVLDEKHGKFLLLDRDTIIKDEGPIRAAQFFKNSKKEEYKERFEMMRTKSLDDTKNYIVIVARKEE